MDLDDSDDARDVELSSLSAIYPEIQQVYPGDRYTIALDVPVTPSKAVIVSFPAAEQPTQPVQPNGHPHDVEGGHNLVDQQELAHLPPVHLEIAFGPGYPTEKPPKVTVTTTPPWLPLETIQKLQDDASRLWEELGRDMVGFTYIDHVQQAAEEVFGLVGDSGTLEVDGQHKISILDYDIQARRAAFERETFECGVCLDPKKGSACHKMMDCEHVFCVQCLQDFYNDAIEKGELASVRCLAPGCAKEREKVAAQSAGKKRKKVRTFISPSELLQIPLDQEKVKRYVSLKYKTELESDKNTIYCPRQWCNGAARSKKHKKPQGLELCEVSEDEDDDNKEEDDKESRLAICEECSYAFCSRCQQSWHGEFVRCMTRRDKEQLTAEEKASLEYMKLHTTPCPTCAAPAQKTQGCNHMICYRCQTHFCYLCSAWLDPGNPYFHFNQQPGGRVTSCYMRLWELEHGDGDDVGYGFAGGLGQGARPQAQIPAQIAEPEDAHVVGDAPEPVPAVRVQAEPAPENANGPAEVAREGPLVLRIGVGNAPVGAGRGGPRGRAGNAPVPRQAAPGGRGQNNHPEPPPRGGARARGRGGGGGAQEQQQFQGLPRGGAAPRGQGRAGRVRGRGGGAGAVPARQNANMGLNQAQQPPAAQQRRNNNNNNQNQNIEGQQHVGAGGDAWAVDLEAGNGGEGGALNAAQEAWIRQFVQLAMDDEEDEMDDEDEDEWDNALLF
ncbi:E3 ubiquitin-protein ligase itt1 [Rhypophila decipiens]